ncbi:MAG: rhombotarget lipoprotein [Steroidobacteraceae bacterium]
MRRIAWVLVLSSCAALSGCAVSFLRAVHTGNSSSLVEFLYPQGAPPPTDTIPELRIPLRVGLAFLPSKPGGRVLSLDAQQKQDVLERIRQRFLGRKFVSEIVVIPDYYLASAQGYAGLAGIQRLHNVDLIALVSYDQVSRQNENNLSLAYLTIVGAYIIPGTSRETTTLLDLAVVDPATQSLVLRAGGTSSGHGLSTLVDADRDARKASVAGFKAASTQLIENFDAALTAFEANVRAGKANVRVVNRNGAGGSGGAGAFGAVDVLVLALLLVAAVRRVRSQGARCPAIHT